MFKNLILLVTIFWMVTVYAEMTTLFSFDDARNLKQWNIRKGTTFSHASWPDGHPGSCGKITFLKFKSGQDSYPAIVLLDFKPEDWQNAEFISFDIFTEKPGPLAMQLRNRNGERINISLVLQPGRNQIRQRVDGIDKKQMSQLHIFTREPASDLVFYIGDIQLKIRSTSEQLNALSAKLETYRKWNYQVSKDAEKYLRQATILESELRKNHEFNARTAKLLDELGSNLNHLELLKQEQSIAELSKNDPCTILWVSPMEKVHRENQLFLQLPQKQLTLSAARGETESAQLVIRSAKALQNLTVKLVSPLKNENSVIPERDCLLAPVGYVYCEKPSYEVSRTGYWPDPILTYADKLNLEPGKWQSYFLDVTVPLKQNPGIYHGTIAVRADDLEEIRLNFQLKVRKFTLPEGSPYPIAVTLAKENITGCFPNDSEKSELWYKLCSEMLFKHRMYPDSLYHLQPTSPTAAQSVIKQGALSFNVRYFTQKQSLSENDFRELDEAVKQYRELGVIQKAILYCYDETPARFFPEMTRELKKIRSRYPDLKIATTAYDPTLGAQSVLKPYIDIWIPMTRMYGDNFSAVQKARQRGNKVWWYIACDPRKPYANWLMEYPSLDARLLMGTMSWKYQPDGFLYYCILRWKEDLKDEQGKWHSKFLINPAMTGAPLTNWSGRSYHSYNGDGNLIYPGTSEPLPSIRLKNIRDGLEDYLYFRLLNDACNDSSFMSLQWRKEAMTELKVESTLVKSLTEFAVDPGILLRKRERIAQLLDAYTIQKSNLVK